MNSVSVIKYGGHAMDHLDLAEAFACDVAALVKKKSRFVIVHGGGPQISRLLSRLAIESRFVNGLRVTDAETMEVVEMALAGTVNKDVVARLASKNVRAVGISGRDGNLLTAKIRASELGYVGDVTHVNPDILHCLLGSDFVPVVAPIAQDEQFHALNVNADTAAGAIAGALQAETFVLLSDVPGVLDAEKHCIPRLDRAAIAELTQNGVISGGMIPKVEACLNALRLGAHQALILDGRASNSLLHFVTGEKQSGTVIVP
ncbi:MAG: acetylglutamate kinase [Desulfovibrionaceae bacterium]|nr:acetylglutamate kinase [Desulfovibrionaceae bacterium]